MIKFERRVHCEYTLKGRDDVIACQRNTIDDRAFVIKIAGIQMDVMQIERIIAVYVFANLTYSVEFAMETSLSVCLHPVCIPSVCLFVLL